MDHWGKWMCNSNTAEGSSIYANVLKNLLRVGYSPLIVDVAPPAPEDKPGVNKKPVLRGRFLTLESS